MTSAAVCSPNSMDRATSSAVDSTSVPSSPERDTTASSSSAVRAEASSSSGEKPSQRRMRFAELLRKRTSQPNRNMNTFCGRTTRSATRIGWAMAQFLGTSSPNTICVKVTTMNAPVVEIAVITPWLRPVSPKPSANSTPTDGPVRKPAMRLVTVMPS